MAGKPYYPLKFIHLRLEVLYTAEHVVLELEKMGLFKEDWKQDDLELCRSRAVTSIRAYFGNNLPESADAHILVEHHRKRPAFTGARIIAEAFGKYGHTDYLQKYKEASRLVESLDKNPKLVETIFHPAFTPDAYVESLIVLNGGTLDPAKKEPKQVDHPTEHSEPGGVKVSPVPEISPEIQAATSPEELQESLGCIDQENEMPTNGSSEPLELNAARSEKGITSRRKKRFQMLGFATVLLLVTSFTVMAVTRGWLKDLTETRRKAGTHTVSEILQERFGVSSETIDLISRIKDEKDLYRYAENEMLSGRLGLSQDLFEHILATTTDENLALFTRFRLAEIKLESGRFAESRDALIEVNTAIGKTEFAWYGAEIRQRIALSHIYTGENDAIEKGLAILEESGQIITQESNFPSDQAKKAMLATTERSRSIGFLLKQEFDQAAISAKKSAEIFDMLEDNFGLASALLLEGFASYLGGNQITSMNCFRRSEDLITGLGERRLQAYLAVMRSHMDDCSGITIEATQEIIARHRANSGDVLPDIYRELFANLPCPERND